jgi:hypothetical protein
MIPARSPWRVVRRYGPSRVQSGSRFQFAENTGAFNDCVGLYNLRDGAKSLRDATPGVITARYGWSRCKPGAQSPISTLIAVLTVPAIVVAVGLVWSQL